MTAKIKYADEGIDCKKYFLFFLKNIWILLLAMLAGAVLGGGIYLFVHVAINSNREYRAESKLYLNFAPDETGEVYQAYNGYTWNDLVSTEPILKTTMSYLPPDYTEEEVTAATSAQILSDLRLLTITVTTADPERTAEILKATDLSLVDLGKTAKEFHDIEIYKETEARIVAADDRLLQAVLIGVLFAVTASLLTMALIYALNDKIYVPSDCRYFTALPFAGFLFTETNKNQDRLYARFEQDLQQNREYLEKQFGTLAFWKIEKDHPLTPKEAENLRQAGGVLLIIPYGKMDRASCAYQIEQMEVLECHPAGLIIADADMRFMRWYYRNL